MNGSAAPLFAIWAGAGCAVWILTGLLILLMPAAPDPVALEQAAALHPDHLAIFPSHSVPREAAAGPVIPAAWHHALSGALPDPAGLFSETTLLGHDQTTPGP